MKKNIIEVRQVNFENELDRIYVGIYYPTSNFALLKFNSFKEIPIKTHGVNYQAYLTDKDGTVYEEKTISFDEAKKLKESVKEGK